MPRSPAAVTVRLAYREPYDLDSVFGFVGRRAVPGAEHWDGATYARSVRLPHGTGVLSLTPVDGAIECGVQVDDGRDVDAAVELARRVTDLDADPAAIVAALGDDPLLGPVVRAAPGRRVPGTVDGAELAVRAVLGQQVSVVGARTLAGRLVADVGEPLARPVGAVTHLFPTPAAIAAIDPDRLAMPNARKRALIGLCAALAAGDVVIAPEADRAELERRLLALPGIGPWTVAYVAFRALGDRDAFMPSDLGVRHALERLGHAGDPTSATALAERWRPFRAYALAHLWASLG